MAPFTAFPRGSEWRKWDYHVHTPASWYYNDKRPEAFADIAAAISASDCAAFGINDYVTIDGYLRLRSMVSKPIFPVIEFRMNNVLLNKNSEKGTRLNFHLLFTNEDRYLPEIQSFLSALTFTDFNGAKRNLTPADILTFGKQVSPTKTQEEALRTDALAKVTFDFQEVLDRLREKRLKEKCLIIIPYDEYGGIDGMHPSLDGLHKSGLIKAADLIGSSSPKEREYFLGRSTRYTPDEFNLWVGKPKPIIKGSDSHTPATVGILPAKADGVAIHCWIKADLTFDGLKQVVYEPDERVFIGSQPPDVKEKSKVIHAIEIRNGGAWFEDQRIELNRDLVTIIGGKGSGKTALVDLLAVAAGDFDPSNASTFLAKANKELIGTKLLLQWENGTTESELEIKRPIDSLSERKIRYLSQSFVESLCSFDKHSELEREIENILFQYVPPQQSIGATSFQGLKDKRTIGVQLEIDSLSSSIRTLNSQIFLLEQLVSSRSELSKERDQIDKDITELHKQKPQPSSEEERKPPTP